LPSAGRIGRAYRCDRNCEGDGKYEQGEDDPHLDPLLLVADGGSYDDEPRFGFATSVEIALLGTSPTA